MSCGLVEKVQEAIDKEAAKTVVNVEDQSKNFSGADTHCKITYFKAGQWGIQHAHKYPHLSVLLDGVVIVTAAGASKLMKAEIGEPCSIMIEANEVHKVRALTDAVWMCIHNTLNEGEIELE